jgi:hypothetical protein
VGESLSTDRFNKIYGRCPALPQNEQDISTRRNAFQMLSNQATDRAVAYLMSQIDRVADWGDILQMAVLDLIRKVGSFVRGAIGLID